MERYRRADMLYKFIDTTEYQNEIALPSEAMNFNGVFLENEVEGYRTLYVTGRESIAPELDFYESGARHGKKQNVPGKSDYGRVSVDEPYRF